MTVELRRYVEIGLQQRAQSLYQERASLDLIIASARKQLLTESRKQKVTRIQRQMPTLEPIWTPLIIATVNTPHRLRTKPQFWPTVAWLW